MHFSTLAVSMLASSAMAYPHRGQWRGWQYWQNQNQNQPQQGQDQPQQGQHEVVVTQYVTHVVTAGGAPAATNPPQQPEIVEVEATTTSTTLAQKPKKTAPAAAPAKQASSGSGSSSGSSGLTADQQGALDAHNKARKEVGNDPLTWDDSLAAGAQEWADHLVSVGSLVHSQGEDGENLYMGYSETPYTDAVNAFLSEKSQYHGEAISGSNYMGFGHYTQCVWKTTTRVGMAVGKGSDGATYVVARYQKPGNMIGDKPY